MLPTPPVPEELLEAFRQYQEMVIIGHENPDGDSLTSQMALGNILREEGKTVHLISPGPFKRYEIQQYADKFSTEFPSGLSPDAALVIVLDSSSPDRIGKFSEHVAQFTTAVIDHHAAGNHFGDIRYIHSRAFSVTFMIQHIAEAMHANISKETAQLLLFGLATDTGFFRHIPAERGEVFHAAADLVEAGASPKAAHEQMYGCRPFESRKLLGILLARTERHLDGRLLITWENREEHEAFGEEMRDSETLYAQLLGISGCEAVIYIREDADTSCTVGLRSNHYIDVGQLASQYGGGGHRRAAGFTYHGPRGVIQQELCTKFTKYLQ